MGFLRKLIPTWLLVLVTLISLGGIFGVNYYRLSEINKLKLEIAQTRIDNLSQVLEQSEKTREVELELQTLINESKRNTDAQTATFNQQRDSLLKRLRVAEARANSNLSETPSTPGAAEAFSRDDLGEFLNSIGEEDVQEAERADIIRVNLLLCYASYDRAREALEQIR